MRLTLAISLFFFTSSAFSQIEGDTSGMQYFNVGFEYYENGQLDSALYIWKDIVDKEIAKEYDTYGNAFFNVGVLYQAMGEKEKAHQWYLKIIDSDLQDWDETGLLMEPHTNYKHKSALRIAGIYYNDTNYVEALKWLNLADTTYRYWGFEGSSTSVSKKQSFMLEWKVEMLLELGMTKEAIREIVIELICAGGSLDSFFTNSEDQLIELLKDTDYKAEFYEAVEQMEIVKIDDNNWYGQFDMDGIEYSIPISNVYPDWDLPHYWRIIFVAKETVPKKADIISRCKNARFFNRLK